MLECSLVDPEKRFRQEVSLAVAFRLHYLANYRQIRRIALQAR